MTAPGWYADPYGRYAHRYWDGANWTEHVGSPSGQAIDPHGAPIASMPVTTRWPVAGVPLVRASVLIVSEKANRKGGFAIYDERGQALGGFAETGRQAAVKVSDKRNRANASAGDAGREYRVNFTQGQTPILGMTRQNRMPGRAREILVQDPNGFSVGFIRRQSSLQLKASSGAAVGSSAAWTVARLSMKGVGGLATRTAAGGLARGLAGTAEGMAGSGHVIYHLDEPGGRRLGTIQGTPSTEWGFTIGSPSGESIGTLTKDWGGWRAAKLKRADHFVVLLNQPLPEPLRSLAIVAACAINLVQRHA